MASPDQVSILIVDDRPENALALREVLARPDYKLVTARSGSEALKLILRHEFALILLDVIMPSMDGFETANLIRQRELSKHLPIIFLTAQNADVSFIYKGYSVGAVDYLIKPVEPEVVRAKVSVFVDLFRKTQQIKRQEEKIRQAEQLAAAAQLRESESQYEATFNEAPVGIAHLAEDGRLLRVNQHFCEILGHDGPTELGLWLMDSAEGDDVRKIEQAIGQLFGSEIARFRSEIRLRRRDSVAWVDFSASLLRDEAGTPKNVVVTIEDISEQKRSETGQRLLAQASEILLCSLDYEYTLERVARLSVPDMGELSLIYLAEPDRTFSSADVPGLYELALALRVDEDRGVAKVLRTGEAELIHKIVLPSAESDAGEASAIVVPLKARSGVLGAIVWLATSRRYDRADLLVGASLAQRAAFAVENARLYRDAQNAITVREEFLSIASHELRTPLTTLTMQLQRLAAKRCKGDQEERYAEIIRVCKRQADRLAALTGNLLDVARFRSGQFKLDPEPSDLSEIVRDVASRLSEEIVRSNCRLEVDAPPVSGVWDRLRLDQVVTNLVSNAIKYAAGKTIFLSVAVQGDTARLTVCDEGMGIAEEDQARIFERFERAVPANGYGGLGLGLYIVRTIVAAHGGSISLKSESGVGSTFTVVLPRNEAPTSAEFPPPRGASEPPPLERGA